LHPVTSDRSDSKAGTGRLHAEMAAVVAGAAIGLVGTAFYEELLQRELRGTPLTPTLSRRERE